MKGLVESLIGCLFNAIWILSIILCYFVFKIIGHWISLPEWLKTPMISVISVYLGFYVMAFCASRLTREKLERIKLNADALLIIGVPALGCGPAITAYEIARALETDESRKRQC